MIDPIKQGLATGWQYINASTLTDAHTTYEADVIIVGSGAGGAIAAEVFTEAGLKVIIVEMGGFKSSSDFNMEERDAYPNLYQEAAARKTKDKAISILQGRTVGGSTTVNWTTSIRTPQPTQDYWQQQFGVKLTGKDELTPFFEKAEKRLNIKQWAVPPNENNDVLRRGCEALDWSYQVIHRNVNGCANLGYCGMGCPINAKQSMLITTIPYALDHGATLISHVYVQQLDWKNDQITAIQAVTVDNSFHRRPNVHITLKAKHYVISAGAIGTPSILLRSDLPNPSERLGRHTYLHPTVISAAMMPNEVAGHSGAPQSIYSDQFLWPDNTDGGMGYKLEVPPIHPLLISTKLMGFGAAHAKLMHNFNRLQLTIALLRDGFHPQSQGGTVEINQFADPIVDYPISDYFFDGAKQALLTMAELQFAAGAKTVFPLHDLPVEFTSWKQAQQGISDLVLTQHKTLIASAHVMGGCNMGEDPKTSVVNSYGRHHQLENLSVIDGSCLPTSLGANPQLTLYALSYRNSQQLLHTMLTS